MIPVKKMAPFKAQGSEVFTSDWSIFLFVKLTIDRFESTFDRSMIILTGRSEKWLQRKKRQAIVSKFYELTLKDYMDMLISC